MKNFEDDVRHDDKRDSWAAPVAFGNGNEPLTLHELEAIAEGATVVPEEQITEEDRQEMVAYQDTKALESLLGRLSGKSGKLGPRESRELNDAGGDLIALRRPDEIGGGFVIWGPLGSREISTPREAAELLGGVR